MRIAFPTDEHFPFQDEDARAIALQIVSDYNPDLLVSGSDGLDFYNISRFDKNPERIKVGLQKEIDRWQRGQMEWRDAAPNALRRFLVGNHEERLRTYLWQHPEIADLRALRLENLLELEKLGIHYDGGEEIAVETLVIKHGRFVRKFSGMSAKAELENERYSISTLTGHSHRGGSFFAQTRGGIVQGHEGFCLCRLDPEYVVRPDWQQGIVLAEVSKGVLNVESIPFHDVSGVGKRAIWRGKEYFA